MRPAAGATQADDGAHPATGRSAPLVSDTIRPFVLVGANMQVCSPPQDPITYLDLGFVAGLGVDVKLHERVSVGLDYKFTWFGVADQEEEDYGMLGAYIGFNF